MKIFSFSIKQLLSKKHLLALTTLLLLPSSLPAQPTGGLPAITEDKAHVLYQAGARYGERYETLFIGKVQKLPQNGQPGSWVVDGSDVLVSESTSIKGQATVGSLVELEGRWRVRNSIFTAYTLRVLHQDDPLASGNFTGTVSQMPTTGWPAGIWIVDGRKIRVNKGFEINEQSSKAKIGATVTGTGSYVDGVFTASAFNVNPPEPLR
jgi:hypothetical protein